MKNTLTDSERAALLLQWYNGEKSPVAAFVLSHDGGGFSADPGAIEKRAYRWRNSLPVRDFVENLERNIIQRIGDKGKIYNSSGAGFSGEIDFRDPAQFIDYLNTRVNELTDEKDKREYLKIIADLLRFKEGETTKDNDIMRFYTPVNCAKCPLYEEKRVK